MRAVLEAGVKVRHACGDLATLLWVDKRTAWVRFDGDSIVHEVLVDDLSVDADPSLPLRQKQMLAVICDCQLRQEPTDGGHLARLMMVRYGVSRGSSYDLLSALHRKGRITLVGRSWRVWKRLERPA
jgi:hypothetical protein